MTIKSALASLTPEQRQKLMECFNNIEPCTILLEDECFLSVHSQIEKCTIIEQSTYWLLGRFK